MIKLIIQSIRQTIVWTVIAGVVYPLVITVIAQVVFHDQANGSLVDARRQGHRLGVAGAAIHGHELFLAAALGLQLTAPGRRALLPPAAATWARPAARCRPTS